MNAGLVKRLLLVAALAAVVILFFALDLQQHLTLENLKASRERFEAIYQNNAFSMLAGFFAVYVIVTMLSLPGGAVMGLAGGALFGFWPATIIISFASTIGATLACALARYLLRDVVQRRFGERLRKINQGVEREGAFYLFTLRLIPIFPFFVINLVMGLTPMRLSTYYWVSQIGMLPGTMVFVNAGKELGQVQSAGDIFSPGLLLSFALLGLFPLAAKKLINLYRRKKGVGVVDDG